MRKWGDLPDVTYTNEQAASRVLAALSSAGYQVVKVEEQGTERGFEQPDGSVERPWGSVVDVTDATHERPVWRGPWKRLPCPTCKDWVAANAPRCMRCGR
jgi:hypothetical protein